MESPLSILDAYTVTHDRSVVFNWSFLSFVLNLLIRDFIDGSISRENLKKRRWEKRNDEGIAERLDGRRVQGCRLRVETRF